MSMGRRGKPTIHRWLARGFFASHWILAPIYVGLAFGLATLVVVFGRQLVSEVPSVMMRGRPDDAIMLALSLVDITLAGNLLLTIIYSGSEIFASGMDIENQMDRRAWLDTLDFSGLKMRLIASIVAISGVSLLREFMSLAEADSKVDSKRIGWMVALHLAFVTSGILLAGMERLTKAGK
jgi:uncharacterized protein (TIGR00645 family)